MRILGFNFTKLAGERTKTMNTPHSINVNVEFLDLVKDKIDFIKDDEVFNILYKYGVLYTDKDDKTKKIAEIAFEGNLILSTTKEEAKDILKHWKKKELPSEVKVFLYNVILNKCAIKTIQLQDELTLPSQFLRIPQVSSEQEKTPNK